ncbi:hypothetical protein V6N13_059982 [Hibiscus sabdariffa]|uniref:Dol-P-Glc:Glc(2)Man(9)GlcNAc(2)-PP-Dol alpha-1,2-glucosyltransferase n=1 Tax=Hibiscus sabdariffa TaxID=183260 RepID=A0ABR2GC90_9ROSI
MAHRKDSVEVDDLKASNKGTILSTLNTGFDGSSNLRRRNSKGNAKAGKHSFYQKNASSTSQTSGLLHQIQAIVLTSWRIKWKLLVSFSPFFFVLLAFVAFLFWNGSVVLGAKEAHVVSPHFAQIMYFSLVSALLAAPLHFIISYALDLFQLFWKNRLLGIFILLLALIASLLSVHFFRLVYMNLEPLDKTRRRTWILVYFFATSAVLIPAPLIEFRYYTIPFYFFVLHTDIDDSQSWLLMGILYTILDVFTMEMFLFRPFQWAHEPGVQRFIW